MCDVTKPDKNVALYRYFQQKHQSAECKLGIIIIYIYTSLSVLIIKNCPKKLCKKNKKLWTKGFDTVSPAQCCF